MVSDASDLLKGVAVCGCTIAITTLVHSGRHFGQSEKHFCQLSHFLITGHIS